MARILTVLGGAAGLLYPFLVLWVLTCFRDHMRDLCLWVLPVVVVLLVLRGVATKRRAPLVSAFFLTLTLGVVAWTDAPDFFKLYPILVTGAFLVQFGLSLAQPPSMVERFAALMSREPLPQAARAYCRRVTWVWCGFFIFNILTSAFTALCCSWEVWTLYNGCISYILMGFLMGGEWLVRLHIRKQS